MDNEARKLKIQQYRDKLNKLLEECPHSEFTENKEYYSNFVDNRECWFYSKRCNTCEILFDFQEVELIN